MTKQRAATGGQSKDGRDTRGPGSLTWEQATELLGRRQSALIEHAARYSLCREDAEDAYQRAAEKLLTRAPSMSRIQMHRWMKTVLRNEALTIRKQRQRVLNEPERESRYAAMFGELDWVSLLPAGGMDTESRVEFNERVERAHEALSDLKPDERRALGLLGKGYSYGEIGEVTGWTYTKVNRCLAEGRKRFRERFDSSERGELCEGYGEPISRFCDGELEADQQRRLRDHLRTCAHCRATLASYRAGTKAAAALAPAPPLLTGLTDRAQEILAGLHSRLPARPETSDAALGPALAGGGTRGGGMAVLAKVAVLCAGAGGGTAACVAGGIAPLPVGADRERERPPAAVAAERSEQDQAAEAAPDPEPAAPATTPPAPEPPRSGENRGNAGSSPRPAPEPTTAETEFTPEAAGAPLGSSSQAGGEPSASASGAGGGQGAQPPSGSRAPESGPPPAPPGGDEGLPPIGGGSGEFGP